MPPIQGWKMESRDWLSSSCPGYAVFLTASYLPKQTDHSLHRASVSPPVTTGIESSSARPLPWGLCEAAECFWGGDEGLEPDECDQVVLVPALEAGWPEPNPSLTTV